MEKEKKPHRQGDLLFVPRPSYRNYTGDKKSPDFRKNGIIREGEATGHHHRIKDLTTANVFLPQDGRPIVVTGERGATVTHPEHGPIKLDPDTTYDVHFAREHDLTQPNQMRYVVD